MGHPEGLAPTVPTFEVAQQRPTYWAGSKWLLILTTCRRASSYVWQSRRSCIWYPADTEAMRWIGVRDTAVRKHMRRARTPWETVLRMHPWWQRFARVGLNLRSICWDIQHGGRPCASKRVTSPPVYGPLPTHRVCGVVPCAGRQSAPPLMSFRTPTMVWECVQLIKRLRHRHGCLR